MAWIYDNHSIKIGDSFIYEVTVYKLFKDRAECIQSFFISSPKLLSIKKENTYIKKLDFILNKNIQLLEAPEDFVKANCKMEAPKRKRKVHEKIQG